MNKKNLRKIAAGFLLFAFSIGMLAGTAGLFGTGTIAEDGDDLAVENRDQYQEVDFRIDEPCDNSPDESSQVVDYRIDLPSYNYDEGSQVVPFRIDTPSSNDGESSQVVPFRIDLPW